MPVDRDSPIPRPAHAGGCAEHERAAHHENLRHEENQRALGPVARDRRGLHRQTGARDGEPGGIVVTVQRAGFIRGGKVVRRAEVIVARAPGGE
jgi:hypothetical protein